MKKVSKIIDRGSHSLNNHDHLCRQKYAPYEDDSVCHDCDLIAKARRESYNRGFEDGYQTAIEGE